MDIESRNAKDFALPDPYAKLDDEVLMLSSALQNLTARINQFVERERNFTRDASHELRSPLTVIRLASDRIMRQGTLSAEDRATVERIQRAVREMEETTEVFLLLARESDPGLQRRSICVNDLVREEIDRASWIGAGDSSGQLGEHAPTDG
jgi:signal transduction histidine kinase